MRWGLAARRSAGGIESDDIAGAKSWYLCGVRRVDQNSKEREQARSGLRPLGRNGTAAAMVLAAITVVRGLKRSFGPWG